MELLMAMFSLLEKITQLGYTEKVFASGGCYDLELLVKPDTDLDGLFFAFDTVANELLQIHGWNFIIEKE
jgi:hypothetical protein